MDGLAKLKPYTFWLVTGAVLLVMLIYFGFILTAVDEDGNTVEDVVGSANTDYNKLRDIDKKAQEVLKYPANARVPSREIEPEDPKAVEDFIKSHLMHRSWKSKFEEVLKDYQGQIASIRQDLARRSAVLSQPPLSTKTDLSQWHDDYQDETEKLLREMYESRRLGLPLEWTGRRPVPDGVDLRTKEELRAPAGFWTLQGGTFPQTEQWPQLTARFRVVQALWVALKDVGAPMLANPLAGPGIIAPAEGAEGMTAPVWIALAWPKDVGEPLSLPGAEGALLHRCSLVLHGHPSALLAAAARLETVHEPVLVRLGTTWKRRQQGDGMLLGLAGEQMELNLELAYIDFALADAAVAPDGPK